VDAEVGEVEEERLVLVARDEVDGVVGEEVGEVLALRVRVAGGVEVEVLAGRFDRLVEPALPEGELARSGRGATCRTCRSRSRLFIACAMVTLSSGRLVTLSTGRSGGIAS
jgi:hypothetical protein